MSDTGVERYSEQDFREKESALKSHRILSLSLSSRFRNLSWPLEEIHKNTTKMIKVKGTRARENATFLKSSLEQR